MNAVTNELTIPGLNNEDLGTLYNVGDYAYYKSMVGDIQNKRCPFCTVDTRINKVFAENLDWMAWERPFLKDPTLRTHIVIPIRNQHITDIALLRPHHWQSLGDLIREIQNAKQIYAGAIVMRFGEPRLNAGSIRHLHANIIVPNGTGRVEVTLAKHPDEMAKKRRLLEVFEKMRLAENDGKNPLEVISPEEHELVKDRIGKPTGGK